MVPDIFSQIDTHTDTFITILRSTIIKSSDINDIIMLLCWLFIWWYLSVAELEKPVTIVHSNYKVHICWLSSVSLTWIYLLKESILIWRCYRKKISHIWKVPPVNPKSWLMHLYTAKWDSFSVWNRHYHACMGLRAVRIIGSPLQVQRS